MHVPKILNLPIFFHTITRLLNIFPGDNSWSLEFKCIKYVI